MKLFSDLPLKSKVTGIILFSIFIMLFVTFITLLTVDFYRLKKELVTSADSQCKVIGQYCIAPIRFQDLEGLDDVLSRASSIQYIKTVTAYSPDKEILSTIGTSSLSFDFEHDAVGVNSYQQKKDVIFVVQPIIHKSSLIGYISFECTTELIREKIYYEILLFAFLLAICVGMSLLLVKFFQRIISDPILNLAGISKTISYDHNLSIDLNHSYNDEIGQLYINFNNMISQIKLRAEARDQAIIEAQESNDRLGLVLDSVSDGFWDYDIVNKKVIFSNKWLHSLGYKKNEIDTNPKTIIQLIHIDDVDDWKASQKAHFENVQSFFEVEYRILRSNGTYRWTLDRGRVVKRDEFGNPLRMVGTSMDISSRKEGEKNQEVLEAQLRQARKLETIGTLAGGISHDFKNILTPILGFTDLVIQTLPPNHEVQDDLQKVLKAAKRANELVNQILAFSRQSETEKKPVLMAQIVEECIPLLRASISTTIDIRYNIESGRDYVLADATQLQQVVMNLCTNAYQAMEDKGGVMNISLRKEKIDYQGKLQGNSEFIPGWYSILEVEDSGKGIPRKNIERIFDPFFTNKKVGKGTGLGLSVVHGVITRHNGFIDVDSEIDKGTKFIVYLPIRELENEIIDVEEKLPTLQKGNENILVIDDEEINAYVLKRMLSNLGYSVTFCSDSEEALKIFRKAPEKFDLIITDHQMPKITGLQLARKAREIVPNLPIIIITGSMELINDKDKYTEVSEILVKPFEIYDINQTIRKVLN